MKNILISLIFILPLFAYGQSHTIQSGESVTLRPNGGSLGTDASYKWYSGSCGGTSVVPVSSGGNVTVSPSVTTTYYVRAEGTCGITICESITIIVEEPPLPCEEGGACGSVYECSEGGSGGGDPVGDIVIDYGTSVTLKRNGGTLGTGASFKWRSGSCGGTYEGTGDRITVSPEKTTTYYVRAEGTCGITSCASITVAVRPPDIEGEITASDSYFCNTSSITLTAPGGTGYSYQWQKDGVNISGATSRTYVSTSPGFYKVIVSKGAWCRIFGMTLYPCPISVPPIAICPGETATLTAQGEGTMHWYSSLTATTPLFIGNPFTSDKLYEPTTFYLSSEINGEKTVRISVDVNVQGPSTVITASGSTAFCGTTPNVTFTAASGAGYTYQWKKDGIDINGATSTTYMATRVGAYSVEINGDACMVVSNVKNVLELCAPTITADPVCAGSRTTLVAEGEGTIHWYNYQGQHLTTGNTYQTPPLFPESPTTFYASSEVDGVYSSRTQVNVLVLQAIDARITHSGSLDLCSQSEIILSGGVSFFPAPQFNYQWKKDGVVIAGATEQNYTVTEPGSYTVQLSYREGPGCPGESEAVVVTGDIPGGEFSLSKTLFIVNETFSANYFPDLGEIVDGYTFIFEWGDGEVTNSSTRYASHRYGQTGVYYVTITATNAEGCSINETLEATVLEEIYLECPNLFTAGTNGTMESAGDEMHFNGGGNYVTRSNDFAYEGDYSLKITATDPSRGSFIENVPSFNIPKQQGKKDFFKAKIYVPSSSGFTGFVQIAIKETSGFSNSKGSCNYATYEFGTDSYDQWVDIYVQNNKYVFPEADNVSIELYVGGNGSTGVIYLDNMEWCKVDDIKDNAEINNSLGNIILNPTGGLPEGEYTYRWYDGPTTKDRTNLEPGEYTVEISKNQRCGFTFTYTITDGVALPVVQDVTICSGETATLTVEGAGEYNWYSSIDGTTPLFTGNPFITPELTTTTNYFVAAEPGGERVEVTVNVLSLDNPPFISTTQGFPMVAGKGRIHNPDQLVTSGVPYPQFGGAGPNGIVVDNLRNTVYACADANGIWVLDRNTDHGRIINKDTEVIGDKLRSNATRSIEFDEENEILYVGTWGGGVWRYDIKKNEGKSYYKDILPEGGGDPFPGNIVYEIKKKGEKVYFSFNRYSSNPGDGGLYVLDETTKKGTLYNSNTTLPSGVHPVNGDPMPGNNKITSSAYGVVNGKEYLYVSVDDISIWEYNITDNVGRDLNKNTTSQGGKHEVVGDELEGFSSWGMSLVDGKLYASEWLGGTVWIYDIASNNGKTLSSITTAQGGKFQVKGDPLPKANGGGLEYDRDNDIIYVGLMNDGNPGFEGGFWRYDFISNTGKYYSQAEFGDNPEIAPFLSIAVDKTSTIYGSRWTSSVGTSSFLYELTQYKGVSTCSGESITLTANSGSLTGELSYQWLNDGTPIPGAIANTLTVSEKGLYSCIVSAGSCTFTTEPFPVLFNPPLSEPVFIVPGGPVAFCSGGSVVLNAPAGFENYQWLRNNTPIGGATAQQLTAALGGSYSVEVSGSLGCGISEGLAVTVLPKGDITAINTTPSSCASPGTGVVTFTITGDGSLTFDYYIRRSGAVVAQGAVTGGEGVTVDNLLPGSYTVETSQNGACGTSKPFSISNGGPVITACVSSVSCGAKPDGSELSDVNVTVRRTLPSTSGSFTYNVVNVATGANAISNATGSFGTEINLQLPYVGSNYRFDVVGPASGNNCETVSRIITIRPATLALSLDQPAGIYYKCFVVQEVEVTLSANLSATSCNGTNDPSFVYEIWQNGAVVYTESSPETNITVPVSGVGQFTAKVSSTGMFVCEKTLDFEVLSTTLVASANVTPATCFGAEDGTARAAVSGGFPPYSYQWMYDDGTVFSTLSYVEGLAAGNYFLEVRDSKGCPGDNQIPVEILEPDHLGNVTINPPLDNSQDCIVAATLENRGGTEPYSFHWTKIEEVEVGTGLVLIPGPDGDPTTDDEKWVSESELQTKESVVWVDFEPEVTASTAISYGNLSTILPGEYIVKVIDANGCEVASEQTTVSQPSVTRSYNLCFRWKTRTEEEEVIPDPDIPTLTMASIAATNMKMAIEEAAAKCITEMEAQMEADFAAYCLSTELLDDELTFTYNMDQSHFTLYYYDRAGNLVKTVPPKGVVPLRGGEITRASATDHKLKTTYEYSSLGFLEKQETPDAGLTDFIYNDIGQLRFSQNAKQAVENTYSYTKYDELGRILEVGQADLGGFVSFEALYEAGNAADAAYPDESVPVAQQTRTVYSEPSPEASYYGKSQRYLLNRVASSSTINSNGDVSTTYYSYDVHGNVEWLIQDVPGMGKNYMAYEYDLVSGNVIKVKYNEGRADRFFHRYEYDEDNRIQAAYTSVDGQIWDKDADYDYYLHGPLKRTVLGEDQVQGIDYVYTLQGWLKGINHPNLDGGVDPGKDGSAGSTIPQDIFGMTLGYFEGDFANENSPYNASRAESKILEATESLYNGNINTWTSNTAKLIEDDTYNPYTANSYRYDELNRIKESSMLFQQVASNTWANPDNSYNSAYSYDANGNLRTLTRHGKGELLDDLTYAYNDNVNNQLRHVTDAVGETPYGEDVESQPTDNYKYDVIGNLIKDVSEEISEIAWTVYGKVASITKDDGTVVSYSYDAAGNRVKKHVDKPGDEIDVTTYYVRDASGNTMAVYNQGLETIDDEPVLVTTLIEQPIYGSERLGQRTASIPVPINDGAEISSTLKNWSLGLAGETGAVVAVTNMEADDLEFTLLSNPLGQGNIRQVAVAENEAGEPQFTLAVFDEMNGAFDVAVVLDKNGNIMPGSASLAGTIKAKADGAAIISRKPGSNGQYLLLTTGGEENGAFIHHIDMLRTGNGTPGEPLGEVTVLNEPVLEGARFAPAVALVEDRRYAEARANFFLLNTEGENKVSLVMKSFTKDGADGLMYLAEFDGIQDYGLLKFTPDGKKLGVVTGNGKTKGWFKSPSESNTLRLFPMGDNYRLVGEPVVVPMPDLVAVNSMDFSADGEFLYYTTGAPGAGHAMVKGAFADYSTETIPKAAYATLSIAANEQFYLAQAGSNELEVITGSTLAGQVLPTGNTLAAALPLQPLQLLGYEEPPLYYTRTINEKQYELKDHLGNVRAVINDVKSLDEGKLIVGLKAYHNYYPFGMEMPDRNVDGADYRYGFNGKEKDNSFGLTSYDYGFRIYNPAIGKFLSVDPLTMEYPMLTPYQYASNRPIDGIDLDGLEYITYNITVIKTSTGKTLINKELAEDFRYKNEAEMNRIHKTEDFYKKYSVGFGTRGQGVLYNYTVIDEKNSTKTTSTEFFDKEGFGSHGFYYGAGCPTCKGPNKWNLFDSGEDPYDYSLDPIDEVDQFAKEHDKAYDFEGYGENARWPLPAFLDDERTLEADYTFVEELKRYLERASEEGYEDKWTNRTPSAQAIKKAKDAIHSFENIVIPHKEKKLEGGSQNLQRFGEW